MRWNPNNRRTKNARYYNKSRFSGSIRSLLRKIFVTSLIIAVLLCLYLVFLEEHYISRNIKYFANKHSKDLGFYVNEITIDNHSEHCVNLNHYTNLHRYSGVSIFLVPINKIKEHLEAIDCIEKIDISRVLPTKVVVKAQYKEPIAIWQNEKKFSFITKSGEVIKIRNATNLSKFIVITGKNAPAQTAALLSMISTDSELYSKVVSATLVGDRRWNVKFDNGAEILLPEQDPEMAWHKFLHLYKTQAEFQGWQYKVLDFRVENKVYAK